MKTSKILLYSLGIAAVFTACSDKNEENPVGTWTSSAPESVTASIDGATTAVKVVTIEFNAPTESSKPGDVTYTAKYDVTVPYVTDSISDSKSYSVTASIKGTYSQVKGEDDDYSLAFDTNSLSVSGVNAPELGPVTDEFLSSIAPLTSIEDVEVSKDRAYMSFETKHPEVKYNFVKK